MEQLPERLLKSSSDETLFKLKRYKGSAFIQVTPPYERGAFLLIVLYCLFKTVTMNKKCAEILNAT